MLHLAGPLLTPVLAYFPGPALGMVVDLPGPAAHPCMRWCHDSAFAWAAQPDPVGARLRSARLRILTLRLTDDESMIKTCTRKLLAAMPNPPSELNVVSLAGMNMRAIGHVGAFRSAAEAALWPWTDQALHR